MLQDFLVGNWTYGTVLDVTSEFAWKPRAWGVPPGPEVIPMENIPCSWAPYASRILRRASNLVLFKAFMSSRNLNCSTLNSFFWRGLSSSIVKTSLPQDTDGKTPREIFAWSSSNIGLEENFFFFPLTAAAFCWKRSARPASTLCKSFFSSSETLDENTSYLEKNIIFLMLFFCEIWLFGFFTPSVLPILFIFCSNVHLLLFRFLFFSSLSCILFYSFLVPGVFKETEILRSQIDLRSLWQFFI